jgi:CDP-paratose 2-epimerase
MYGINQHSTSDQGWIGWFCYKALEIKNNIAIEPFTISGTGKQVRDVLNSADVIRLYFSAKDCPEAYGQAFNIGGGIENSLSLLELFSFFEAKLKIEMKYKMLDWRESDQKVFIADNTKIRKFIDWEPKVKYHEGLDMMLAYTETITNK